MARPHRPSLPAAALVAGSVTLAVLLAEIMLRLVYPIGAIAYRLDERHFQEYVPNASKVVRRLPVNGGDRIAVGINGDGFRGRAIEIPKPAGRRRILVYGDSYVAAEFSDLVHTFPAQLEQRLSAARAGLVEVVNAGVPGAGPDQVARRLPADMQRLQPELVLLVIAAHNDFGDLIRNRIYRLDERGVLVDNPYVIDATLRQRFEQTPFSQLAIAGLLRAGWRGMSGRLGLAADDEPALPTGGGPTRLDRELRVVQGEYDRFVVQRDQRVRTVLVDRYDADVSLLPTSPSARYKTALMQAVVGRIRDLVRARGAALLVVAIPSPYAFELVPELRVDRVRYPLSDPAAATSAIAAAASRQGIEVVDLYETMAVSDPSTLYFEQDTHWNDRGQARAAAVVGERILQAGLLP